MDNENTHSPEQYSQPVSSQLGARFRAARESANLSIEDVAVHLRLTCQLVQDIENDDYSRARRHLVFLRGYLRAYSKLVELPADEMIATFNSMNIDDVPIHKPSWQTEEAREIERAERSNWLAFMILSTLLVFGVLTWWYAQHYGFSSISHYISDTSAGFTAKKHASLQQKAAASEATQAELKDRVQAMQSQIVKPSEDSDISDQRAELNDSHAQVKAEITEVKPEAAQEQPKQVTLSANAQEEKVAPATTHKVVKHKHLQRKKNYVMSGFEPVEKKKTSHKVRKANRVVAHKKELAKTSDKLSQTNKGEWLANQLSQLADESMSTPAVKPQAKTAKHI